MMHGSDLIKRSCSFVVFFCMEDMKAMKEKIILVYEAIQRYNGFYKTMLRNTTFCAFCETFDHVDREMSIGRPTLEWMRYAPIESSVGDEDAIVMPLYRIEKKPSSTVISFGRDVPESYIALDRAGRPIVYNDRGYTYKRSLDGTLHVRHRHSSHHRRERRVLTVDEAKEVLERAYAHLEHVREHLMERREEVMRWTPDKLLYEEKMRFREVYAYPITILPPDAYFDVVLQATFGCTWNQCTFCSFYKDRTFAKRDAASFREHVRMVRAFLGDSLSLRKNVFLADGNVLALGEPLIPLLKTVRTFFPERRIASFLDLWSGYKKDRLWWKTLAELGLYRVSIGLESGSSNILRIFNKPGEPEEAIELIHDLKQAGLAVNVIFLVGAGGVPFREEHFRDSMRILSRLTLHANDIVYLSPLVHNSELAAVDPELTTLPDLDEELSRWFDSVKALGYKASLYDIREFLY